MSDKVQKMAPEEMAIMENIKGMMDQMMASGGGMMEDDVMMAAGKDPQIGDEYEEMMVKKMMEYGMDEANARKAYGEMKGMKGSDAMKAADDLKANPDNPAEDRLEETTPESEESLMEVMKAFAALAAKNQPVQKAAPAAPVQDPQMVQAMNAMSEVLKSINARQTQTETALSNILEGLGVTEQVQKSLDSKPENAPVGNLDGNAVLNELFQVLKSQGNAQPQQESTWGKVQKSQRSQLGEAIPHLLKRN